MNALPNTLARFSPPLWLMSAMAALLGAALLVAFVDTLRDNIRRGEEMRQWQRAGISQPATTTVVSTAPQARSMQSGNALPQVALVYPTFKR